VSVAEPASGLYWADAMKLIRPIIDSEIARGNRGGLTTPTVRDSRTAWVFRYRLDIVALRAQFDFGDGVSVLDGPDSAGAVTFRGSDGMDAFVIAGRNRDRSWFARRRQAAWWAGWRADAPLPQPFENPFATLAA
jgi:hypothetical protein